MQALNFHGVIHLLHQFGKHLVGLRGLAAHVVADSLLPLAGDDVHGYGLRLAKAPASADALVILLIGVRSERDDVIAELKI